MFKGKKKKSESEFDKKIMTRLFALLFITSFVTEAISRYMEYRSKKKKV